jgi:DMSO reductase family type II enzyme heme b subunit
VWGTGTYRVVLRRTLTSGGADAVTLRPGQATPAAFAIWDGAAGDRDGKKSVTIWQDLRLDP